MPASLDGTACDDSVIPTSFEGFLGLDGGGSRCRARLCDPLGRVVAEAEGGAANVYLDFEGAVATVKATVDEVLQRAGLGGGAGSRLSAGLGLAGVSSPAVAARVGAAVTLLARVQVVHDGVAACLGAHGGQDGGLVIAGTGSGAVLWRDGHAISIGGRGFLLGDDGSGAVLGRALWRRALRAHDGLEPKTPILAALMAEYADDPVRVIAWGRAAPSYAFAAYAPQAFASAADADPAALAVVSDAANAIAELVEALRRRSAPRIALVGGMAEAITPYLPAAARAALKPPLADALDGALFLAGLRPNVRSEPTD